MVDSEVDTLRQEAEQILNGVKQLKDAISSLDQQLFCIQSGTRN